MPKNGIGDYKVLEKVFRKNRWYVTLDKAWNGRKVMPHANYIWLRGNPSFSVVPKGYVVHHLDGDKLNDDISNLVIMSKHHHTAYHWKHKNIEVPISLDEANGFPLYKPGVYYYKKRNVWVIKYRVRNTDGSTELKAIYNIDGYGKNFRTKEEAENAIQKLWPGLSWD